MLGRVVGQADITDIKIIETNTDDIVRSIYQSGSAVKMDHLEAEPEKDKVAHV
ncbi:hypothetical protein D3C80_2101520 [compost metagenome]